MADILTAIFGVSLFLFIFWRRLREDYVANQIFSTSFFILIGITLSYIAAKLYFDKWWFWAGFLGALLGTLAGVIKYRMRFYEVLEAGIIGLLPWLTIIFAAGSLLNKDIYSAFASLVLMLLSVIFLILDSRYKTFTWYRSGRIGFTGVTVLALLFLIRSAVAVLMPGMVSFVGKWDALFSGIAAFLLFFSLLNLARKSS